MIKNDKKRKTRTSSKAQESVPAFLLKTYEIIEDPEYNDIISWNREGNAFIVKKINDFSEKILPKYFKHNNFASFVRQLNMYDFHKSRHENNENEFRHKLFRRGQKHLLKDIKRKISDNAGFGSGQLVPANKDFDIDKFKKDASHFTDEIGTIKRHQNDLEKVTKMIYNQNSQLLKENKLLWNELIKNKEKYEKKIEKLMVFIFSVMRSGYQLGPSATRKSITNSELSDTLNQIANDDPSKKYTGNGEGGPLSILPDKKETEQIMQKMTKFLHDKGSEANIDSLLEHIQNGNMEDLFKNQQDTADEDLQDDRQNYDPNTGMVTGPPYVENMPRRSRRLGAMRNGAPLGVIDENQDYGDTRKQVKMEPMPMYSHPRDIMSAQQPIDMMNQDINVGTLGRGMSAYEMGPLSRDHSFNNGDLNNIRNPPLIPQKSSIDYMYTSPKPFANNMKEDEMNDLYNIDDNNYKPLDEEKEDEGDEMEDYEDQDQEQEKNDQPGEENGQYFNSMNFMGNDNQNGYNFNQGFDDQMYKS